MSYNEFAVAIIITIHNGEPWIDRCFEAIEKQTILKSSKIEICICDDASVDLTQNLLLKWKNKMEKNGNILLKIFNNIDSFPKGVGFGKNRAVELSTAEFLCFQDIDDIMMPDRILSQLEFARSRSDVEFAIIGSKFRRNPPDSTKRYTNWCNNLNSNELNEQIYTSNGPTIAMPTWFMHRNVFYRVNGFSELGKGTPEDLLFFYKHLDSEGKIYRVDEYLLIYEYHKNATTFSINEKTIWDIRLKHLESNILAKWLSFTIWNAGKQGRRFFNSLGKQNREKVKAFCDVDAKKIGKTYQPFCAESREAGIQIPIVKYTEAEPPFVICVKIDMTNGVFENNLQSLNLVETVDYIIFS